MATKRIGCGRSPAASLTGEDTGRSSFDRFGDDLTELIVGYLSITDKFRFECLSKRIRSLIYNKQNSLRISLTTSADNLTELILKPSSGKTGRYPSVNHSAFAAVVNKLSDLRSIRIDGRLTVDSQLVHTIARNSRRLKHLWITVRYVADITNDCLKELADKCGPTLLSLKFDGLTDKQMRLLLSSSPQLLAVTVDNVKTVLAKEQTKTEELTKFLPKLREIQFCRCTEKTLRLLQTQYSDTIVKVRTHLLTLDLRSEALNRALTGFALFRQLECLDLFVDVCDESDVLSIDDGLRQMASELSQLRQLSFTLDGNLLQNNNLFSIFANFKSLSSLEISVTAEQEANELDQNSVYNYGSISELKRLTRLKHLSLTLDQLSDDCLQNIDKSLPNLRSLRLNTKKAITDKSLHWLLSLHDLTTLEIICFTTDVDNGNISDSGVRPLIEKSRNLRTLLFDQKNNNIDFNITEQCVEAMALRAKRMPKIEFNLSFAVNNRRKLSQLNRSLIVLPNLTYELL